jgi:hypothetical protein
MFVRVVLDTCTVRNHIHSHVPSIDLPLVRRKQDQVRLSLSASAFVELTAQLTEGRIPYADWQARVSALDAALDPRWPCLPNGKQLAWLAGTQVAEPIDVENESRHMRAYWHHLLTIAPHEIGRAAVRFQLSDRSWKEIRLNKDTLDRTIKQERKDWIDYVKKMQDELPEQGLGAKSEDKILDLMRTNFGTNPLDAPGIADKLDGVSRMIARFVSLSLAKREPYNPQSEGRRGDTFDLNLLFYLPLPSVIVSGDKRFVRGLRGTDAPQARQVILIEEFNAHLAAGTLPSLVSGLQSPERQFRTHKEAAYSRWEKRYRPANDDWSDWFASEPVA